MTDKPTQSPRAQMMARFAAMSKEGASAPSADQVAKMLRPSSVAPLAASAAAPDRCPDPPRLGIPLTRVRFCILDTETTGPDPDKDEVIEVAARGWSLDRKVKFPRIFEAKIDPGCKIPPGASAVHHITDEDVAGAPRLSEVIPELCEFMGDSPLVAFNSEFDRKMLRGTPLNSCYWLDVYRLAMRTWHIGQENEDGFALTSFKQQELRYWLGLKRVPGDAHRAAADIMVTGLVFQVAAEKYLAAGLPDDFDAFADWLRSPIQHITIPLGPFGTMGKKPEDLEDWQLKKMMDPQGAMFHTLQSFNVLDCVRPEYDRRGLGRASSSRRPYNGGR